MPHAVDNREHFWLIILLVDGLYLSAAEQNILCWLVFKDLELEPSPLEVPASVSQMLLI